MRFHDPNLLWLLLMLAPWLLLLKWRRRDCGALPFPSGGYAAALPVTWRTRAAEMLPVLRLGALLLCIVALARPQEVVRETKVRSQGLDLMIVLDLSTSMLAESPSDTPRRSRLAMAKEVLADFMRSRPGDRFGVVAFAARPYQAAPLTLDHAWLQGAVSRLETGIIEDGTAIGDAILAALNRLRNSPNRSRAVILLTDGRNNTGSCAPHTAAAAAKALGIRVHTIGIGSRGQAVIPVADPLGGTSYRPVAADLDEGALREIAATTGGSWFLADDKWMLEQVLSEMGRLEQSPIESKVFFLYRELFPSLLLAALLLVLLELFLKTTWLRQLP